MKLPSFNEFLQSIDISKISYDLSSLSPDELKDNYNPFTKEEYSLLVQTNITITTALLAQYHQWLNEKFSR